MKLPVRILLVLLCAALILAMPFVLSSPNRKRRFSAPRRIVPPAGAAFR